jgi:uncharacterized protein
MSLILVSALLFDSIPGKLTPLWKEKSIIPLCSKDIMDEYLRVLAYPKFNLTDAEIDYLFTVEILPWFCPVTVLDEKPYIKDDPHDDIFVWCAVAGKAYAIISGDTHLLKMKNPSDPVITVVEFLSE